MASVSEFVVRLEGLPFKVSKEELLEFFQECEVAQGESGVHLVLNHEGRASGLGFVELASQTGLDAALNQNNKNVASYGRYVKVEQCPSEELAWHLARQGQSESKRYRVRLQGLPFRVPEYEIAQWLGPEAVCPDVEIHLNSEGRPSGNATAYFDSLEEAEKALKKDQADMRGRYIKLHLECGQPLARTGHFVRMSGLPYRATEDEMKDFFKPAECVSVRPILNHEGRASGNAIAEFETEEMVEKAMERNKEDLGTRFVILTRVDAGGSQSVDEAPAPNGGERPARGTFSVRLSGLPFRASVEEIKVWFQPEAQCDNVRVLLNREGRPSGEAIAEFATKEEADQAMTKNRQHLGNRYVILKSQY